MLSVNSLPGPVRQPWLKSCIRAKQFSIRAELHPKEFNHRPPPSPLRSPSLRRGWIVRHEHDKPESGLEVLLSRTEDEEERKSAQAALQFLNQRREGEDGGESRDLAKPEYVRGADIDKKSFTRVYYVSALRVPAKECWDLAHELRGYLLNWPRVNNIGRVLGDDVDRDLANLFFTTSDLNTRLTANAVRAAVNESSAEPTKPVKTYWRWGRQIPASNPVLSNSEEAVGAAVSKSVSGLAQGVKLKQVSSNRVAKSLPKDRRLANALAKKDSRAAKPLESVEALRESAKMAGHGDEQKQNSSNGAAKALFKDKKIISNSVAKEDRKAPIALELVEADCESEVQSLDQPCFKIPGFCETEKWVGPTRLLLLDEKYLGQKASELPIALQAVLSKFGHGDSRIRSGLVTCRLTLFYEYWSLEEVLGELLPAVAHKPVRFERTGHVAELKLCPEQLPFRHLIGQLTLDKYHPALRSVLMKKDEMCDENYAVQLELLAGSSSLVTTAWEHGIPFRVDMVSVIWDSRLGSERQRLVGMFSKRDIVCDVGAGVGLVVIPAGKAVRRVFANEANPYAHYYLSKNVVENGVTSTVEVVNEDMQVFLSKIFHLERPLPVTQLVMSHPSAGTEFLEMFEGAFKRSTWPIPSLPRFHLYGFSNRTNSERDFSMKIADVLGCSPHLVDSTRVIEMPSGQWMVRASFVLPASFGFQ